MKELYPGEEEHLRPREDLVTGPRAPPPPHQSRSPRSPILLTHKQVKGIFGPQEIVIIQDLHSTHPVRIKVSSDLKTDKVQQENITSGPGSQDPAPQKPQPQFHNRHSTRILPQPPAAMSHLVAAAQKCARLRFMLRGGDL